MRPHALGGDGELLEAAASVLPALAPPPTHA